MLCLFSESSDYKVGSRYYVVEKMHQFLKSIAALSFISFISSCDPVAMTTYKYEPCGIPIENMRAIVGPVAKSLDMIEYPSEDASLHYGEDFSKMNQKVNLYLNVDTEASTISIIEAFTLRHTPSKLVLEENLRKRFSSHGITLK